MSTIAVVGAGPGLGLAVATTFAARGYDVALIARDADRLAALVDTLESRGATAAAFPADAADPDQITAALTAASEHFGAVDVLEYSPHAGLVQVAPQDMTVDDLRAQAAPILHGAVAAAQAVLPAMRRAGTGTLLFAMGGGAIHPYPMLASTNAAQAGLRNWAHNLHNALAPEGIQAATVAINVMIGAAAPEGVPHRAPDEIAQLFWDLHTTDRDRVETAVNP